MGWDEMVMYLRKEKAPGRYENMDSVSKPTNDPYKRSAKRPELTFDKSCSNQSLQSSSGAYDDNA
jgi:hypothetical protein